MFILNYIYLIKKEALYKDKGNVQNVKVKNKIISLLNTILWLNNSYLKYSCKISQFAHFSLTVELEFVMVNLLTIKPSKVRICPNSTSVKCSKRKRGLSYLQCTHTAVGAGP